MHSLLSGKHFRWLDYYWRLRNVPPRGTALKAIEVLKSQSQQTANPTPKPVVDLGAGHGPDTVAFLNAGFKVVAVEPSSVGLILTWCRALFTGKSRNLKCIQSCFSEVDLPDCACINASFALPFCPKKDWPYVWQKVLSSLEVGGVFSGQFFGLEDSWRTTPLENRPALHFSEQEVRNLLSGFHILDWKEINEQGFGPQGEPKNWHVYHVVAQKL